MNTVFDREEALKKLRLVVFEKRAVATLTASGGNLGENQGAASRKVNIVGGGALGGSRSSIYEGAGGSNTNALLSASKVVPKPRMQRMAMRTPSPPSAARMGMGVQKSPGSQLSVGKVSKLSTKVKLPASKPMSMDKAAHIVALQKEAALPAIGAGLLTALRGAAAAGGLRSLATRAASYMPKATSAVKNFVKGFRTKTPSPPAAAGITTPRHGVGFSPSALGATKPTTPGAVDKAISFFRSVASSEAPKKTLIQGAKGLAGRGAKGAARFAYNRGKSATKFGLGAGGLATAYSMMKNPGPDMAFKDHVARAIPYAAAGAALGTGGVFGLGLPAAAVVKPSMERYLIDRRGAKESNFGIDSKKRLSMGSDFGKKTGILESDAARRRRLTSGLSRLSTEDIKSYI